MNVNENIKRCIKCGISYSAFKREPWNYNECVEANDLTSRYERSFHDFRFEKVDITGGGFD